MSSQLLCLALLIGQPPNDPPAFIDAQLAHQWQAEKLTPAAKAGDHEFLRRASLDMIGRIPTGAEIERFLRDEPPERRRLLIDRLLKHDEAPRHWANVWTDWLLDGAGDRTARAALHGWLQKRFASTDSYRDMTTQLLTAKGTVRDNPAVHFILAQRGNEFSKKDWQRQGQYDMFPLTDRTARIFLGVPLGCVRCHDQPDGEFRLEHFAGMNAFFRQIEIKRVEIGKDQVAEVGDNDKFHAPNPFRREGGSTPITTPIFLDGRKIAKDLRFTRREAFARLLTESPLFAKAHVNRMWAYFFGHSLCKTPAADELADDNIVHPELLDRLAEAFVKSKHDPQALIRWICTSDAYGLSGVANKTNEAPDKVTAFSRMPPRQMTDEQLVESLLVALKFPPNPADRAKERRAWLDDLARINNGFGADEGSADERAILESPAFRLIGLGNFGKVQSALEHDKGLAASVAAEFGRKTDPALRVLFLHTLGRPPTPRELMTMRPTPKQNTETPGFWRRYYEDVVWELLNRNEFTFNH